ncbi:MAG: radical SAM family heme chaperone HemW, partial [Gammaproteobacteria bacterium]|nr:radical SAM family heme chaperone HemW [Gammaproteobacteria bacterium]
HLPWCVRKCPYCDFNSYTLAGPLQEDRYVARLLDDLEVQAPQAAGRLIETVFLGGGSPSLFSPRAIGRLLEGARRRVTLAADAEVTLEANPGTIERGAFTEYRAAGINRVSLGAQSFAAEALQRLGRIHSPAETQRAAAELHAAGLDNFNLDLMYALPGQDVPAALTDIDAALALAPAHLSHYQLTLEPGTVFAAQAPALPADDVAAAMLEACTDRLARAGLRQYEVSAYARPGNECGHNLNYWTFGDYLGIGAGAHGKLTFPERDEIVRTVHTREPRRYLAGGGPVLRSVPRAERAFEFMLNALRLCEGFGADLFEGRTGLPWNAAAVALASAAAKGLVLCGASGCRPTPLGLRFLNEMLLVFLPEMSEKSGKSGLSTGRAHAAPGRAESLFTGVGALGQE